MAKIGNFDRSVAHARAAIGSMLERTIPPDPEHFSVWYSYHSGDAPAIRRAIESMLARDVDIDAESSRQLYDRFVRNEQRLDVVEAAARGVESSIGTVLGTLSEASSDASGYGRRLVEHSGLLDGTQSPDVVQATVREIVIETRAIAERNARLEAQLAASRNELREMRDNLERLRDEALTDGLTGIANRKRFDTRLAEEIERATQSDGMLCLLMVDVDHFKAFNDTHGHRVGDEVLRVVARAISAAVKGGDLPARYGGEEFAVILPGTTRDGAFAVAELIRRSIALKNLKSGSTGVSFGTVTVSIGLASFRPGDTPAMLIQRADERLYMAKHHGRNCVVVDGEDLRMTARAS